MEGKRMTGAELIEQIRTAITGSDEGPATDRAVAKRLGISITGLSNWKKRETVTPKQITGLMLSLELATEARIHSRAIQPIVEFFELSPKPVGSGDKYKVFGIHDNEGYILPYLAGLKVELESHHGVYLFYDSRGRALYAGKARYQSLWTELNLAYNRDRGVQNILRVNHPQGRKDFRTSDEVTRQIRSVNVRLHELAAYVSAYRVVDAMIGNVESLLIRAFPNDLLNKRMENINWG
jgi:hypothetical protein